MQVGAMLRHSVREAAGTQADWCTAAPQQDPRLQFTSPHHGFKPTVGQVMRNVSAGEVASIPATMAGGYVIGIVLGKWRAWGTQHAALTRGISQALGPTCAPHAQVQCALPWFVALALCRSRR